MDILTTEEVLRAEANAIHGEDAIAGDLHGSALYRALGALDSAALCLSGGGIRSAAFALGVIQALASHPRSANGARVRCSEDSLLGKFHYLSTVSGGGYIGGWLSSWVARTGFGPLWPKLLDLRARPEEEPGEIAWLRRYSNYLTPKLGIGSADAWTVVAIFIRNLVLNWLVLLPVLCGALADLGNAVRKIKLDLGVAIRFRGLTALVKRQDGGVGARTPYHAIGEIDYPDADGTEGVRKGLILYIKPAYHGSENIDIRSYAAANPDFPHQSTTDQWFGESQFESYRALGFEITDKALQTALARLQYPAMATLDQIFGAIATATAEPERPGRRRRGAMREAAEDTAA
jgi:hypothetical protein